MELRTITSTLEEISARITALVDVDDEAISSDLYNELVGAERTISALLRRLQRATRHST